MQSPENNRAFRRHVMVLMYIVWLTVSLAPAMVTPPEKSFPKGQPELQQAMDNMVTRKPVIQKRISSSSTNKDQEMNDKDQAIRKIQEINFKTSKLLAEAEKIIETLPDSKERHWIESFVKRMREVSTVLETTSQHKNLAKDFDSMKGAPVPDDLPKPTTEPATTAVPEIVPIQKPISMMSKIQMTSKKINKVVQEDEQSYHQAVTKPVALSNKRNGIESDELVRELESLHEENTHGNVKRLNQARMIPTTSSPLFPDDKQTTSVNKEAETAKLKAKLLEEETETAKLKARLIEEIEEFHSRGGVMPKEVIDILNADNHRIIDPTQTRKFDYDKEMKFTEAGMTDSPGMMRLNDLNNENRAISMANMRNMRPYTPRQFQYLRFNYPFPNRHPNFVQNFPQQAGQYVQNIPPLAQPYQGRPQNMDQNFQKMNPYNQGKYHELEMLNQQGHNPDAFKQKLLKPYIPYNGRLPPSDYHNYFMRHNYGPYPYAYNWNSENSTNHLPQMMQPYGNNQGKVDTQLSDEMKRELRDGKIIVLSDSVVRSNFEPDNKKTEQITTEEPELQQVDTKNETISEN